MTGRLLVRLLLVLVLLGVAAYVVAGRLRATAVVTPVRRELAVSAAPGTINVLAERSAEVRSEVSGRIAASNLALAGAVKAGDVLVEIDPTEIRIQIEQIETDLEAARRRLEIGPTAAAELLNARDELVVREELFKAGSEGANVVERQRRAVSQIEQRVELEKVSLVQQVEKLEGDLALNRHRLSLMTVRSPVDGVIADINAGVGDLIHPGSPIARVTSRARIVEAKVSEENFAGVRLGQRASVRFLQYSGQLYTATVARIMPEADPLTQRYRVHLDVAIEPERLVPGITGEASINLDQRENALVIPRSALIGGHVFVVEDERVVRRAVKTGFTGLNEVEILEGLADGELVIIDELDTFREGDRVRLDRRDLL